MRDFLGGFVRRRLTHPSCAKCENEFDRAAYFPVTTRPQADRYPRANARSLDFNVSAVRSRSRSLKTLRFLVSIMPYARYGALRRCLTGSLRRRGSPAAAARRKGRGLPRSRNYRRRICFGLVAQDRNRHLGEYFHYSYRKAAARKAG